MTTKNHLESLLEALRDPRMAGVLGPDAVVDLALWILEKKKDATACRLLYGWVLSSRKAVAVEWRSSKETELGVRLVRLTCTIAGQTATALLEALLGGSTLAEASRTCELQDPPRGGALMFARGDGGMSPSYGVSPILLLETAHGMGSPAADTVPLRSPNAIVPAFCVALYLSEKARLWAKERENVAEEDEQENEGEDEAPLFPPEVARCALTWLERETGLRFRSSDGGRLGNLEFLAFPAADGREEPVVELRPAWRGDRKERPDEFRVEVREGYVAPDEELLVRCRQFAGPQVVGDECHHLPSGRSATSFAAEQGVGSCALDVWRRKADEPAFRLWFAERYYWISQIQMHMGIMGLTGREESDLLSAINSPRLADRVAKLMTISQVRYQTTVAGEGASSWELANREGRRLASRLFPPASGARFFRKGWHAEGRLSFLEWLRDVAEGHREGLVVLVDPFFDSVGVDVFAGMSQTQLSYAAVTSTQVPSADDDEETVDRARRILDRCRQKALLLRNLDFRVYDVRSTKDRPLHDRYLLLFDGEGTVARGFHLSNSIQRATRGYPFLVTPIPDDVLEDVAGYVRDILQGNEQLVGKARVETLYERPRSEPTLARAEIARWDTEVVALLLLEDSPPALDPPPSHREVAERAHAIWMAGGCPRGRDIETWLEAELLVALETRGVSVARLVDIHEVLGDRGLGAPGIAALSRRLRGAEPREFHRLWSTWATICANVPRGAKARDELVAQCGDSLFAALEHELESALDRRPPYGLSGLALPSSVDTLVHYFEWSFDKFVGHAHYFLWHYPLRGGSLGLWGVRAAISALGERPEVLVELAARVHERANADEETQREPFVILFAMITQQVGEVLGRAPALSEADGRAWDLIDALLKSRSAFHRGLGAVAAVAFAPLGVALTHLDALEDRVEILHTLGQQVHEMRVEANRAGHREPDELRDRRREVFEAMIDRWPAEAPEGLLEAVFHRVGGPLVGSWAHTTVEELFFRLVDRGVLGLGSVVSLVVELVLKRVERTLEPRESGYQYFATTDAELTEVGAALLARADEVEREQVFDRLAEMLGRARRTLGRPFARSADYDAWSSARDGLRWGAAFLGIHLHHGCEVPLPDDYVARVHRLEEEAWGTLDSYVTESPKEDVTGLAHWAAEIRVATAG